MRITPLTIGLAISSCMLSLTTGLGAQQQRATVCGADEVPRGEIGYSGFECNCVLSFFEEKRPEGQFLYRFRSEPVITGIKDAGPADGKLRVGDVVTAIDGHLITTYEGGRRFANPQPGQALTLAVRRGGREVDVQIVPGLECFRVKVAPPAPAAAPAEPAAPAPHVAVEVRPPVGVGEPVPEEAPIFVVETPRPPSAPAPAPAPLRPHTALPKGWFGFGISCSDCVVKITRETDVPVWTFSSPPTLENVESGSPAYRAGMRAGDVLTYINGQELTSAEGGRRFGAVQPGDTVDLRFVRDNTARDARVVAGERVWSIERFDPLEYSPEGVASRPPPEYRQLSTTRFTGILGDAHIQVTGGPITVSRTEEEVVIQSRDITVRIRKR
ncbi:MAG: PDZ domain-containing protein [Gemmatimonadota bacterium]|nr:PDZ domain-containing protein [Gemmatimonadota bacterium]